MEPRMENPVGKELHLRMDHMEEVRVVAHALSSDVRLRILAMIGTTSMNVNEIARELGAPVSTTALNIQVLERAGLVSCEMQPGARGAMKMCVRGIDRVYISLSPTPRGERRVWECEMPVGCYALVGGVQPTCGMANRNCKMNADDDPRSFYRPNHFEADLLWMRAGFVEYHFPPADVPLNRVDFLELSFEACSETLGHNNRWPSSIYVEINGQRLGVWHCEGDFGGRRGQLNPPWWDATNTQFGQLKTWRVDRHRTYLDGDALSNVALLAEDQSHYKAIVELMHEMYQKGLISPEYDIMTDEQRMQIFSAGNWLICWSTGSYPGGAFNYDFDAVPYEVSNLLPPTLNEGDTRYNFVNFHADLPGDYGYLISANVEQPEVMCSLLDYMISEEASLLFNWGIEGETYEINENGKPEYIGEYATDAQARLDAGIYNFNDLRYIMYKDRYSDFARMSDAELEGYRNLNEFFRSGQVEAWIPARNTPVMNEEQRNTVAMNLTPISTYITENVGLFVTGDRDLSEWDAFVEEAMSMVDIEAVKAAYEAGRQVIASDTRNWMEF